jgi:hypothetical protein
MSEEKAQQEFKKLILWILKNKQISLAKKKDVLNLILLQSPSEEVTSALKDIESALEEHSRTT